MWNRLTESGSRWVGGGWWGVDKRGVVRWGRAAERADDLPDVEGGVRVLLLGDDGDDGEGKGKG